THGALGVGGRGRGEDQAADHEHDRRETERDPSRDAERVVDRGADVPVSGGEERGRPENPLEPLLPAPTRHRRNLAPQTIPASLRNKIRGCGTQPVARASVPPWTNVDS